MNIVLLSGGSGQRLWPLSDDVRAKQFLKLFNAGEDSYESMLQHIYRGIKRFDKDANISIATEKSQETIIREQLGSDIALSLEPARKDTFAAIALASAYMHDIQNVSIDDVIVVCPADAYVNDDYFECLKELSSKAASTKANLVLMGIRPSFPSESFGYIIPNKDNTVKEFKEKPDQETAKKYIAQGAFWNGGVFAFKIKYVLDKAKELLGNSSYKALIDNYESFPKISFDYAVVEKERNIEVVEFSGSWLDLGTWDSLTAVLTEDVYGQGVIKESANVHILNELDIPILAVGLENVVIAASPKGIIISDKKLSSQIKLYVEEIKNS